MAPTRLDDKRAARSLLVVAVVGVGLAALGLAGGGGAAPARAQAGPTFPPMIPGAFVPGGGCGSLDGERFICYFDTGAVAGDPADPGTITIAVAQFPNGSESDITLVGGYAADRTGNVCSVADGVGTPTLMLTCPTGLQKQATGSVTFAPRPGYVSITYSDGGASQASGSALAPENLYFSPSTLQNPFITPDAAAASMAPAGWNLDIPGASRFAGSFYTQQPGDSGYEIVPAGVPVPAGVRAYLPKPVPVLGTRGELLLYVTFPLPPGQWIMIADPGIGLARVTGADDVEAYDPTTGTYGPTAILRPGQGAWAWSAAGGTVTIQTFCRAGSSEPCPPTPPDAG